MIGLYEALQNARRKQVEVFPSFDEAVAHVNEAYAVAHLEVDEDYEDCADFITSQGDLYIIEPVNGPYGKVA